VAVLKKGRSGIENRIDWIRPIGGGQKRILHIALKKS
jgi:hypothetical protein